MPSLGVTVRVLLRLRTMEGLWFGSRLRGGDAIPVEHPFTVRITSTCNDVDCRDPIRVIVWSYVFHTFSPAA